MSAELTQDHPDYRSVLKSIPTADRRALMVLTNWHGLLRLGVHLGVIGSFAVLGVMLPSPFEILAMVGQGVAMCFLFCAMHEASHGTAFRTKWLNSIVTLGAGLLLGLGPRWFKYFHADHHRYTHDPDRDPELKSPKPETRVAYVLYLTGLPLWVSVFRTLMGNAFKGPRDDYIPQSARQAVQTEARLMMGFYLLVIGGGFAFFPGLLIQFWLLPILLGQPFLRAFLLAEHTGCPHDPDMLRNSRTIRTNPVVMLLSWNMSYHTAHHSLPAVPFHQLAAFNSHLDDHIMHKSDGYRGFHQDTVSTLGR